MLVNTQLVGSCQLWLLILLYSVWIICFQLFEWGACELAEWANFTISIHYTQTFFKKTRSGNSWGQFSSFQPVEEFWRDQWGQIERNAKAHYSAAIVNLWSRLVHPQAYDGSNQIVWGLRIMSLVFNIPFQLMSKGEGVKEAKANSLTHRQWRDHLNWERVSITASMHAYL